MPYAHRTRRLVGPSLVVERRRTGTGVLLVAATLFLASAGTAVMRAQAPPAAGPTVWDGVYTEEQAARGAALFTQSCTNCHTLTSAGNRPLSGDKFWEGNSQKSVGDLLTFIKTNMPSGNGGSLPANNYPDLLAVILKSNGFPAGATELTPEVGVKAMIIPKDGPGELPNGTLVRVVGCLAPRAGGDWTLTNATAPERTEKSVAGAEDATRALGDRTTALKFVLTRLDASVGKRMSVTGLLIGVGGAGGLNVSTVNRVADTCP